MRYGVTTPILTTVALLALTATAGAQGFGGSFDDPGAGAAAPAVQPPPAAGGIPAGGDFGGSFGGGGAAPAPVSPPPAAVAAPPAAAGPTPGGSDFGDGGSFNPEVAKPITPAPPPPVRPPRVQPPVAQPPVAQQPPAQPPGAESQLAAFELRDFGVPPTDQLRQSQFHGPTPTSVPGAQVVTTMQLAQAMQGGMQLVLIDVLGGDYTLPNAVKAPALASPGNLRDGIQQQAGQWLYQVTQGNPGMPIVVYCSDPQCWLSYNAALRTVAAGFGNVYWYRGGLQAWQMAGLPLSVGGF
jgi:PQQ-dependent catabolism-associated CXXCW motif protein